MILIYLIGLQLVLSCWPPPPTPTPPHPATQAPATQAPGSCPCGVVRNSGGSKIVGGQNADKNEYPWQVALKYNNNRYPFCGGTLLNSKTVLTAGHCLEGVRANQFKVVLGEHNLEINENEQVIEVSYVRYKDYNTETLNNDFAIIRLRTNAKFTQSVSPICLPEANSINYDSRLATVTGWGRLREGGSWPDILQEVNVNTMTNSQCTTNTDYNPGEVTSTMICARAPGKDACSGDSGGPLITKEGSTYTLIGVVSWGFGCARAQAPGVYSRITSQLEWINEQKGDIC